MLTVTLQKLHGKENEFVCFPTRKNSLTDDLIPATTMSVAALQHQLSPPTSARCVCASISPSCARASAPASHPGAFTPSQPTLTSASSAPGAVDAAMASSSADG